MSTQREQFGSRIGFILAAAGSAVGIGNLVGFPVAAAKNGGGAFLLVYALFVAFICLPVMIAELTMGRASHKEPVGAFNTLSQGSKGWTLAGILGVITPFMIGVFYTVITVWIMGYLWATITGDLNVLANPEHFGVFVKSDSIFGYFTAVIVIVFGILAGGVKDGIERGAKILMPALFVMLIGMVIYVLTLPNAFEGVKYYVIPDFSKINGEVISSALSQAFFSLSLGMGILITYGSYMDSSTKLVSSAKFVALTDTAVAFFAGLMILPAVFSFDPDIDPLTLSDSSVQLIFTFLPKIFLALEPTIGYGGASVVAAVFFILVLVAAITSLVSIIEVPLSSLTDHLKRPRKKALWVVLVAIVLVAIAATMSFGMSTTFTQFVSYAGADKSLFDVIYDVFYDTVLPLNGLLVCIFVIYQWKQKAFSAAMDEGEEGVSKTWYGRYINFSLKTFIPLVLLVVFINTVGLKFFGVNLLF